MDSICNRTHHWFVLLSIAPLGGGCGPDRSRPGTVDRTVHQAPAISGDTLRNDLLVFVAEAERVVDAATERIVAARTAPEMTRAVLRWRLESILEVNNQLLEDNPGEALLDVWAFLQRLDQYVRAEDGQSLFGLHQADIAAATGRLLLRIERLARSTLPAEVFASAARQIQAHARDNPIRGSFSHANDEDFTDGKRGRALLSGVLAAPLQALGAVGKQFDPTTRLANAVDRWRLLLQDYPAQLRWQGELLLMRLDELEVTGRTLSELGRATAAFERITTAARELPQDVRAQADDLLDTVAARQPALQTSLEQANETAATINAVLKEAQNAAASANHTLAQARETGTVWNHTVREIRATATEIDGLLSRAPSSEIAQDANTSADTQRNRFDITDYTVAAEATGRSAESLRRLVAQLDELLDEQSDAGRLDRLTERTVSRSGAEARAIVDYTAWRGAQLLVLAFALAILHRLGTQRLIRPKT